MLSITNLNAKFPFILRKFIEKIDVPDNKTMSIEDFKKHIFCFRISTDAYPELLKDLKDMGVVEDYNKHSIKFKDF